MVLLLALLACGDVKPAPAVQPGVVEAFDVPPPPGMRSLDVGPLDAASIEGIAPGDAVVVEGGGGLLATGEVVDRRGDGASVSLTLYVDEPGAVRVLDHRGPLRVSRPRR